jgi:hypothetical protein
MTHCRQSAIVTALFAGLLALSACGDEGANDGTRAGTAEYCPPDVKGQGVMVSSRYDYEDLLAAGKWRDTMFPRDCAGTLGAILPDLPPGYGVAPNVRPYIMNSEHVFLRYAETKGAVDNPDGPSAIPAGNDIIAFEISRYSQDELGQLRTWMADNPDDFLTRTVDGKTVYLLAGVGVFFQDRTTRVPAGLTAIYDSGLIIRANHPSMFTNRRDDPIAPQALALMSDMMQRAEAAGH